MADPTDGLAVQQLSASFKISSSQGKDTDAAGSMLERFPDTVSFLQLLEQLDASPADAGRELPEAQAARSLFRWEDEIFVARAPGRLDVMGGIADYSGSLVLQMPLAEACHVAVQRQPTANSCSSCGGGQNGGQQLGPRLRVVSLGVDASHRGPEFDLDLSELLTPAGDPLDYEEARALFRRDPALTWAGYVAGALLVLMRECGARFTDSLAILVSSDVPEGKGVSSSAAVEVASMSALAAAHGICLESRQLALMCQQVENNVVGAPCGIMDQMASALGHKDALLALRCQPAEVQGAVPIPPHLQFWGVDSGIRHSVGGSDYGHVRVGAFMGLRIISQLAAEAAGASSGSGGSSSASGGGSSSASGGGSGGEELPRIGGGYLANLAPSEYSRRYEQRLPESLGGGEFLLHYGAHWDTATSVDEAQKYAVRTPTSHPIHENFRVHTFRQVLAAPACGGEQLEVLGELMRQSHVSYSQCGLGSDGTDRLVDLVQEAHDAAVAAGQEPALYGAKITGGGSGGTVCILGVAGQRGEEALQQVVQRYAQEAGYQPKVFRGSSAGAADFGHLRLLRQ